MGIDDNKQSTMGPDTRKYWKIKGMENSPHFYLPYHDQRHVLGNYFKDQQDWPLTIQSAITCTTKPASPQAPSDYCNQPSQARNASGLPSGSQVNKQAPDQKTSQGKFDEQMEAQPKDISDTSFGPSSSIHAETNTPLDQKLRIGVRPRVECNKIIEGLSEDEEVREEHSKPVSDEKRPMNTSKPQSELDDEPKIVSSMVRARSALENLRKRYHSSFPKTDGKEAVKQLNRWKFEQFMIQKTLDSLNVEMAKFGPDLEPSLQAPSTATLQIGGPQSYEPTDIGASPLSPLIPPDSSTRLHKEDNNDHGERVHGHMVGPTQILLTNPMANTGPTAYYLPIFCCSTIRDTSANLPRASLHLLHHSWRGARRREANGTRYQRHPSITSGLGD